MLTDGRTLDSVRVYLDAGYRNWRRNLGYTCGQCGVPEPIPIAWDDLVLVNGTRFTAID